MYALALLVVVQGPPAWAHDAEYAIGARILKIDTRKDPGKHGFVFKASKELLIFPAHDPAQTGSAVLVRWTGDAGAGAGRTELIELDSNSWKGLGNPAGAKGYKYTDKSASRGGIKTVLFKPGAKGGLLKIVGKGAGWDQELGGPHDSVWVHFRVEEEWYCAELGGDVKKNEDGFYLAKNAVSPVACPEQVCGNGIVESGETCDDGNLDESDGCSNACTIGEQCSSDDYDSTFDAIQDLIFDSAYSCSTAICHGGGSPAGGLSLTAGSAYASLVGVPSSVDPAIKRVEPAEPALSVLYDKLHAGNMAILPTFGGSAMPVSATALSDDHLQAMYEWIRGGAPEDTVVVGTAALLATCLPDPDPQTIPPPDPPAPGVGVQLQQTARPLVANAESEICMATYFNLVGTGLVPASAQVPCSLGGTNNPTGMCFRWHHLTLAQDPQSHHSILNFFEGARTPSSSYWGNWTFKLRDPSDPDQGASCDPTAIDPSLGYNPGCSSKIVPGVGCTAFGGNLFGGGAVVSQEAYHTEELADGVFDLVPMAGMMLWNSHAFNATNTDSTLSQYLNVEFAAPADQVAQVQPIFDISNIFIMNVQPFATQEVCANYVLPGGANLFNLTTHTHRYGVLHGARIMMRALGATQTIVGIESDMPSARVAIWDAIEAEGLDDFHVAVVTAKYPAGGENQLIELIMGKEVPEGRPPNAIGIVCQNVGTAAAVADFFRDGRPLISRVVTVSGRGVAEPLNIDARIGTPMSELFDLAGGVDEDASHLIMGGPMMGKSLPDTNLPVTKATNCLILMLPKEISPTRQEMPCIRCGECSQVCPAHLLPQQLLTAARRHDMNSLTVLGLNACIECGCCDFVCPSHILLTDRFIDAKLELRVHAEEAARAGHARQRFEARAARLEQQQEARERELAQQTDSAGAAETLDAIMARVNTKDDHRGDNCDGNGNDDR